ncbi:MAG TPA: MlaD family protein [Kofleriaceae bacterium]|nr:MlaD family protein [Kofleriaceae bacterium]
MSDPRFEDLPAPAVHHHKRGRPSAVWIVPILALLAAGALAIRTYLQSGPTIKITFETADGLEAGKSDVRYKNVPIGKIDSVELTSDQQEIVVTVTLNQGAASLAVKDTRFWVERPRVGVGGVSGLGTLLSGAYIGVDRGTSKEKTSQFTGLEKPPGVTHDEVGHRYRITAQDSGSLAVRSPVYTRRQQVGSISALELAEDGSHTEIEVFIDSPYDRLVSDNVVFWNTSGLDVSLDANGLRVDTQSLATVVAGGIAFGNREGDAPGKPAAENTRFKLFEDRAHAMARPDTVQLPLALRFHQPVRGLVPGAQIDFEGVRVGQVDGVRLGYETGTPHGFYSDVDATVYPERLGDAYASLVEEGRQLGKTGPEMLQALVGRGLRAQLKSGNLLTGQYFIALGWFPNQHDKLDITERDGVWVVPTEKGGAQQIQDQVASIVAKIDKIPFDAIGGDVRGATQAATSLLGHLDRDVVPSAGKLVGQAEAAMLALRESLAALRDNVAAPDSAIQQTTRSTLEQLDNAARSLRGLADYLQHHPESILRGRASGSEPKGSQ